MIRGILRGILVGVIAGVRFIVKITRSAAVKRQRRRRNYRFHQQADVVHWAQARALENLRQNRCMREIFPVVYTHVHRSRGRHRAKG